jgi:hypothetical protein
MEEEQDVAGGFGSAGVLLKSPTFFAAYDLDIL